ncbi:MAG: GNAT family N-acetyltransferase [candidate division Zixibacteria bacterium]|nr:GNAT family N-acetyltransferase [candidate division Zixibacteria bacterium]
MTEISYKNEVPDPVEYLELFETTGWNSKYRVDSVELSHALANSWYLVVAYDGDQLVGVGRVVSDGVLYGMIYDMIVRPSHQGKGVGSTILRMLVEECKSAGLRDIQLFSASGKTSFYLNRGFVERPEDAPGMRLKVNDQRTRASNLTY